MPLEQLFRRQAEVFGTIGAEIFDKDIAAVKQIVEELAPFGLSDVERERALIAIARKEIGGEGPLKGWAPTAGIIAAAGPLLACFRGAIEATGFRGADLVGAERRRTAEH